MENNPFEVEHVSGYYEIPGFSRYWVTRAGKVLNKDSQTFLDGSKNPDGYYNFRLTRDDDSVLTWGRHRLLAFVFKHPGVPIDDLVVNHLNGVKGDDRLDNLEWTTYQGNAEHAGRESLTEKCTPISVRDVDTGIITHYPSIIECARVFGMTKDSINYRVRSGEKRVFPERKQYRTAKETTPWYIPANVDRELLVNGTCKKIHARFVFTQTVVEFSKLSDLAERLHVSPSTITLWINQPNQPVFPGFVQLKWASDPTPWREIDDVYLELDQYTGKRSVAIWNSATKRKRVFTSATECAKEMGLTPTALSYRLKSRGCVVYLDGHTYSYYSDSL